MTAEDVVAAVATAVLVTIPVGMACILVSVLIIAGVV